MGVALSREVLVWLAELLGHQQRFQPAVPVLLLLMPLQAQPMAVLLLQHPKQSQACLAGCLEAFSAAAVRSTPRRSSLLGQPPGICPHSQSWTRLLLLLP